MILPFRHLQRYPAALSFLRWLVWSLAGAVLAAGIFTLVFYSYTVLANVPKQSLSAWFVQEFIRRGLWGLYVPFVIVTARRFPLIKTPMLLHNALIHVMVGIWLSLVHGILGAVIIDVLISGEPWSMIWMSFMYYLVLSHGLLLSLFIYAFIIGTTHAIDSYRESQQHLLRTAELEAQLTSAQLQTLKMQLHPHFLFNTLNSISSLLYKDVDKADTMIARLGDFLRMTLDNPSTQCIALGQELDLLRCYVDIEQLRFPDRLRVIVDVEASLMNAEIPNLLLQPLVENSIRHGILQSIKGGTITISARCDGTELVIRVIDNGPGMRPNELPVFATTNPIKPLHKMERQSSIGLANTRERLERLYGEAYKLDYGNQANGGFAVTIHIPFRIITDEQFNTVSAETS